MLQPFEVRKVLLQKVTDASGLEELIDKGVFRADDVVGVVGKTEGNGGVNDYTRLLADRAFREVLVAKGTRTWDEVRQIPLAWSGGTDGVSSPMPRSSQGFPLRAHRLLKSPVSRSVSP